jgi:hypothetical protein
MYAWITIIVSNSYYLTEPYLWNHFVQACVSLKTGIRAIQQNTNLKKISRSALVTHFHETRELKLYSRRDKLQLLDLGTGI